MDQKNMTDRVTHVIAEQIGVLAGDVKPESHLENDLGADSLDLIELVMALEEEFEIEIADEEAEKCLLVSDVMAIVKTKAGL